MILEITISSVKLAKNCQNPQNGAKVPFFSAQDLHIFEYMITDGKTLYSLIPLQDFKALLGIDDREEKLARFCLVTSTFTIEQYCKRRLLKKKQIERIKFNGDLLLPLREYPVQKLGAIFAMRNEQLGMSNGEMIEPEFYRVLPDCGADLDIPFSIELSPALQRYRGLSAIKAVYWAGYKTMSNEQLTMNSEKRARGGVPADLASTCLELAAWNMNRYRGRRIGMTGNIRGTGKEGEHFEISMPENVRGLLEPYKRKTI